MTTSINLSLRQLAEPGLLETVEARHRPRGISPEALCFEITESVVAADEAEVMRHLGELRELGVGLSLDDFGVGLSSLSALDRYPLDMLKIDRSFVGRLASGGERAERMFSAVLGAARAVGLKAVAEGIETALAAGDRQAPGLRRRAGLLPLPAGGGPDAEPAAAEPDPRRGGLMSAVAASPATDRPRPSPLARRCPACSRSRSRCSPSPA